MNKLLLPVALLGLSLLAGAGVVYWSAVRRTSSRDTSAPTVNDPRLTYATPYKNVRPDVGYVEDSLCAQCHGDIAESYRKHPMGRSLTPVAGVAATQCYDRESHNPFTAQGTEFLVERRGERIVHKETRRNSEGRIFAQTEEEIQFAIGSGIHNYSYLTERDGRMMQSPITWYEQKKVWDLSPGFNQNRDLFERQIFPQCLFCHSNRVEPVPDTLNTYREPVFRGYAIGCQRCHGPGELHVQQRKTGPVADGPDESIVNPRRLSPELREAVCQQCHLEGAVRILAPGREFFDYRPGLPWQPFWSVLVKAEDTPHYRFVSAVEQMYASRCFRESSGKMGCISCHDPHYLPGNEEKAAYYRARCLKCHAPSGCSLPLPARLAKTKADSCIVCHMAAFATADIQHTAASDHQILRQPRKTAEDPPRDEAPHGVFPLAHFNRPSTKQLDAEAERALGLGLSAMPRLFEGQHADPEWARLALPMIDNALKTWPNDVPTLEAKANALSMIDRKAEQLALCEQILSKAPQREQTLIVAAALSRQLGKPDAALDYWKRALAVNPVPTLYHAQLGNLYADRKDWPKVLEECQTVLRRYPANLEARLLMVSYYLENGERERARGEFDTVLALKPSNEAVLRRWFEKKYR